LLIFYQQEEGKITKIDGDGFWHSIKSNVLPNKGNYMVEL
jgi:hypothetical protein